MANLKSNVKVEKHENLWVIDPNGEGNNAVNVEDLNISVELEVLERGDEPVIYTDNNVTTSKGVVNNTTKISFIDGTGNEEKYLTTHYTELNTKFNDKNKDLGTLGIESIDISFNTSYVPIVKIKFKDIRGKLFELGNDSPYAFMFKMPYPIFYLTVKGYYGKPVQYALHMTKFNGSLDNETGSFIITCDFIGYTYAFLSDLLMGILKGIPYTQYGKNLLPEGFTTFEELSVVIKNLGDFITAFREENPQLKALRIYDNLNSSLSSIEESIVRDMDIIFKPQFTSLEETNVGTSQHLYSSLNTLTNKDREQYENSTLALVKKYNAENDSIGDTIKFKLNIDDFKLNKDGIFNDNFFAYDFLKDGDLLQNLNGEFYRTKIPYSYQEFLKSGNIINYPIFKISGDNDIDKYKESLYNFTIDIINVKNKVNSNNNFYLNNFGKVLDIRLVLYKIQILKIEIQKDFQENKKKVTSLFTESINNFLDSQGTNFDASIGSLFKILCEHVDLFINVIKNLEGKIENDRKNTNRKLSAASKDNFSDYLTENGSTEISVGAFPEYIVNESDVGDGKGGLVEKWLGSDPRFANYEEVKFIDDLYASMLKAAEKDRDVISGVLNQTKSWFPVNPLETLAANPNNINPWIVAANTNIQPVMKLILQRMTIFLNYTNSNLTLEEIDKVAKIEANQLYNSLLNSSTKKGIMPNNISNEEFISQINKYYGDGKNSFGKVGDFYGLRLYFKNIPALYFWEENDGNGSFTYHHDKPLSNGGGFRIFDNAFNIKPEFIPLNQTEKVLTTPENILLEETNRKNFEGTFISNVLSNTPLNEGVVNDDEYETFIKIIDKNSYKKNLNYDNYISGGDNGVVNALNKDNLIRNSSDLLGGLYRTHEFMQYKTNNQIFPLYYQFYDSTIRSKLINKEKDPANIFDFNPNFKTTVTQKIKQYSLFGSRFYYNQRDEYSKALLFLHSIPFNGLTHKSGDSGFKTKTLLSDDNLKFFNERGGFISVPKSWTLLVGGMLYRTSLDKEILKLVDSNNKSLIPEIENVDIKKDELLIYQSNNVNGNGPISFINDFKPYNYDIGHQQISKVILNLPTSVKNVFINKFIDWVGSDWLFIKDKLEIFDNSISDTDIINYWNSFSSNPNNDLLKPNVLENYTINQNKQSGNFDLNIKNNSDLSKDIYNFFLDEEIIINGTFRIWNGLDERLSNFKIPLEQQVKYINTFFETYKNLNKEIIDPQAEIKETLFNTDKVDDIKLSLYKNVKSIYNKWILGVHPEMNVLTTNLFKSFNFLDRANIDISDKFKISPTGFINYLSSNSNISFYNFIARILRDNHFDFIPLPTFIDYSLESAVTEIFEPTRFNEMAPNKGPQFICKYFGEQSNQLNIDKKNTKRPSDSFKINSKYDKEGNLIITDKDNIPKDFNSSNQSIPYFLVNYADQNQSLFKKINLDQSEFTETNESLEIIESLSNLNRNNSIGQNLFDIYNNRSYSAEVEMLGCAQIQPFMYFQVNNVPVFDGAYTIINTKHHITANHMTTSFKGVRIRRIKTKMVDDETLYAHLLANLNEIDVKGATLSNLTNLNNDGKVKTPSESLSQVSRGVTPANRLAKKSITCGIVDKNVNNFIDVLRLVINNLEGSYCSGGLACGSENSGETLWGLDRANHSGNLDNQFWLLVDNKKNGSKRFNSRYPKPDDEPEMFNIFSDIIQLDFNRFTNVYFEGKTELINLVKSDGRLYFNMIYAVFNGAGWFKGFAKLLISAYENDNMRTADKLLTIFVNERVSGGRTAFKLGTGSNLSTNAMTLIANTGIDIEKMVGLRC